MLPKAFQDLMASLQLASKVCEQYRGGEEKYDHLDSAEVEKVEKAVQDKRVWAEQQMGAVSATSNYKPTPISSAQVRSETSSFEALVKPIITKPKPKPKVSDRVWQCCLQGLVFLAEKFCKTWSKKL